jgi:seryl-tRNA synthetase
MSFSDEQRAYIERARQMDRPQPDIHESRPLPLWMRVIIYAVLAFIFAAILSTFTGCAQKLPKVNPLDSAPALVDTTRNVYETHSRISKAAQSTQRQRESLDKATNTAAELHRISPPDLRPVVESLQNDLAAAVVENDTLRIELSEARLSIAQAVEGVEKAKAERERIVQRMEETSTALIKAEQAVIREAEAHKDTSSKLWWWRKWVGGTATVLFGGGLLLGALKFLVPLIKPF